MDTAKVLDVLNAIGAKIEEQKEYLTELDNVIGDGDHGINMARGFQMVETKLPTLADKGYRNDFKNRWYDLSNQP